MCNVEKKALDVLYKQYYEAKEYVKNSPLHLEWCEEKIYHSKQVIGAMLYLIKHEKIFQNCDKEFLHYAKCATILHDIGRFEETKKKWDNSNCGVSENIDHSVLGYQFLKSIPEYNNPRIYLAVKHHGHMIEELYEDEEFSSIKDKKLKQEIIEIIFLVRDADKIANYYLMSCEPEKKFPYIFSNNDTTEQADEKILPEIIEEFTEFRITNSSCRVNRKTSLLNCLSWVYDINYISAIDFIIKNHSLSKMLDIFYNATHDDDLQEIVEKALADYIEMRYTERMRNL